ncbi:hypothetical protein [Halorussus sp. AFM4]|uniref:hypothetical protein n=1 Tax=Halorussus sp. AFM4 TaxID=3421651 RepID=UPI003EBB67BD
MTTLVKMDEDTKSDLEELQAEIQMKTGREITQQEILARIVDRALRSKSDMIDSFRDEMEPVDADEREAFHDGMIASGIDVSESDIDDVLYR